MGYTRWKDIKLVVLVKILKSPIKTPILQVDSCLNQLVYNEEIKSHDLHTI